MSFLSALKGDDKDTMAVAPMPERLQKHVKVAILTADDTQDLEFFYPYYRLTEAGYAVEVITPKGGAFKGKNGMGLKDSKALSDVAAGEYALLYIPGGKAPEALRKQEDVLHFVRSFAQTGKPLAAICHGAQLLVSAGLVRGKCIAAWPEVRAEIEESGGIFVNEALVEDGQFITARMPGDLHRHLYGVLEYLNANAAVQRTVSHRSSAA